MTMQHNGAGRSVRPPPVHRLGSAQSLIVWLARGPSATTVCHHCRHPQEYVACCFLCPTVLDVSPSIALVSGSFTWSRPVRYTTSHRRCEAPSQAGSSVQVEFIPLLKCSLCGNTTHSPNPYKNLAPCASMIVLPWGSGSLAKPKKKFCKPCRESFQVP